MRTRGRKFELDRHEGKFLGVCSGLANMTGVDATIIRIGLVLATLWAFPWTVVAYLLAAWLGQPKQQAREPGLKLGGRSEARERMRDIDQRLAAIESYVTNPNTRLANEIDQLR